MFPAFLTEDNTKLSLAKLTAICETNEFVTKRNRLFSTLVRKRQIGNYDNAMAFESVVNLVSSHSDGCNDASVETISEKIFNMIVCDSALIVEDDDVNGGAKKLAIRTFGDVVEFDGDYVVITANRDRAGSLFPSVAAAISNRVADYTLTIYISDSIGLILDEIKEDGSVVNHTKTDKDGQEPSSPFATRLIGLLNNDEKIAKIAEEF